MQLRWNFKTYPIRSVYHVYPEKLDWGLHATHAHDRDRFAK